MIKRYLYPPLKILKYLYLNKRKRTKIDNNFEINDEQKFIVNQLRKNGYHIIQNFLNENDCKKIINEIDETIKIHSSKIWRDKKNSDNRIFGAEKISKNILSYFKNDFIKKIGENYCGFKLKNVMTMANKVIFSLENSGSGDGWHKDAYCRQFKSMIYLNDVKDTNGPFQLVKNSNSFFNAIKTSINLNKTYPNTRFTNEDVKKISQSKNLQTLTGKAGSLIFFDPSLIHRGAPLLSSERYAITNYYDSEHNYYNSIEKIPPECRF
tara:strand:+ start:183 stop:980 length:798 start_codon:yes stop_codon:yes gene_type:complete